MLNDNEIENLIQKLYAWAEKRETINKKRVPEQNELDNNLIRQAIRTINSLREELRNRTFQDAIKEK